MKKICLLFLVSIALVPAFPFDSRAAGEWTGNANLNLGVKYLDDFDWEPLDEQVEAGIDVDFRQMEWPVNLAIAFLVSADEDDENGVDLDGSTAEMRFGIKKIWEPDQVMRPFFGGGLVILSAHLEGESSGIRIDDDDTGFGIWLNGGIYWTLSRSFNLGFNLGLSTGEVTLFGTDVDAGGLHTGLILGYHW